MSFWNTEIAIEETEEIPKIPKEKKPVKTKSLEEPKEELEPSEAIKGDLYQKIKEKFTNSSDFDRALVGAIDTIIPGLINRKSLRRGEIVMRRDINSGIKSVRRKMDLVEKLRQKYTPIYKECMQELSEKLAERKKLVENTL